MIRILAPHFVAGVVLSPGGIVTRAAPIVGYMVGYTREAVYRYCARKGWSYEVG